MSEIEHGQYVDVWANLHPETRELDPNISRWFERSAPDIRGGYDAAYVIEKMNAAGVEKALLTDGRGHRQWVRDWASGERFDRPGPMNRGYAGFTLDRFRETCETVAEAAKRWPDRIYGAAYIDPTKAMDAVRMVEISVREYGFKACRIMPAQIGLPPDHALYYPVYAKCIELGVPITINVGVPGPLLPAWVQRPLHLDEVLVTFPELTIVGTHVGHPWHDEVVALLQKHSNFYLMTSGWVPKYIPAEIIQFMNTRGSHKVMWAADFPLQPFERCVEEALNLPFREGVLKKYMRDNAIEVFGLS